MLDRLQAPGYPWEAFERLVVELLGAMGYGSSTDETSLRVTKLTGDEGIDGVIDEDKLGLDAVYIQAKKYQAKTGVGRPALQAGSRGVREANQPTDRPCRWAHPYSAHVRLRHRRPSGSKPCRETSRRRLLRRRGLIGSGLRLDAAADYPDAASPCRG